MKFGICNEIFETWRDFERTAEYVRRIGYHGIEIAPYTFAPSVTEISVQQRNAIARAAEKVGLEIIGLHWILVGPKRLHLTHPDAAVRKATAAYLEEAVRLCADIGGKIIVFGSPKQRSLMDGVTYAQGFAYAQEVFTSVMPTCEACGVTLCMEPLTHLETNFCTTAEDTVRLIDAVSHPKFQLILDTKAMTFEKESRDTLIRKYARYLKHYHANDENLLGPGFGNVDFTPIFEALEQIGYDGYVSVEVFNFDPGPEAIAEKSLQYMQTRLQAVRTL